MIWRCRKKQSGTRHLRLLNEGPRPTLINVFFFHVRYKVEFELL